MNEKYQSLRAEVEKIHGDLESGQVALIALTRGLCAIVDKQFEQRVNQYRWYANGPTPEHCYAVADVGGRRVSLQRLIRHFSEVGSDLAEVKNVSFQNKCQLDCRLSNLLVRTDRQAMMRNRRRKRTSSSDYKGVKRIKNRSGGFSWSASIHIDDGDVFLGTYVTQEFAAEVYDAASYSFFGASGHRNFPHLVPTQDALQKVVLRYTRFRMKRSTTT